MVVIVLEIDEQVSGANLLIIRDFYAAHDARDFGAKRREVAVHEGVVRDLLDASAFPGVPIASKGDDDGGGEEQHQHGRQIF